MNIGQGFIDYAPPQYLLDFYKETLNDGNVMMHQYTRGFVSELGFLELEPIVN